jgi:methionyl-tRNA formyltransferase
MKLVYFGTAPFAVPALERLAASIVLVVSQPDRPSGRGMKLTPSPVKAKAFELGIPVATPDKCRDQAFIDLIKERDADALLVAAYGQILPVSLLESAKQGAINLHGSILPKYRGAAPIQRCIQAGDKETGVTLMQMDKGMDTGDMIAVQTTEIGIDETYGELSERLAAIAADLAETWMPVVCSGKYERHPQDNSASSHAPKISKAEAELEWEGVAIDEYNKFRAFTPSPGPFLRTRLGMLKLSKARLSTNAGEPGEIRELSPDLVVSLSGGAIALHEVQPEGQKRMSGRDWANGQRLKIGDNLRP